MKAGLETLLRRAQELDRTGCWREAAAAYRTYLHQAPGDADAQAALASLCLALGRVDDAQAASAAALAADPAHQRARGLQGAALLRQGRVDQAREILEAVLAEDPGLLDIRLFLAEALLRRRDRTAARSVLAGAPGSGEAPPAAWVARQAELWAILGLGLREVQSHAEAREACEAALALDPANLRARTTLASIRMAEGALDEAEAAFRGLMRTHPGQLDPRLLLITCLTRKGDLQEADRQAAEAVRLAPADPVVHHSLAGAYYSRGRWDAYRAEIARFRRVNPSLADDLDFGLSFAELIQGDLRQGFRHFEARLRLPQEAHPHRTFPHPAWDGAPFAGKTLLVWAEQGLGDTLMFLRYLPRVKALGGTVVLEAQAPLVDLVATCEGPDLVVARGVRLPPFDLQVSLMSLPWIFRTDLDTIPGEVPYLGLPEEVPHRPELEALLSAAEGTVRIGLVWAGAPGHPRDQERSLPIPHLAPLADLPAVSWFSFQVGGQAPPPLPGLVELAPLLGTFSDTAFALGGMDLLITVDTAMAHLAGALGIPAFVLLAYSPDYRWMLSRDDSPWYPTLRLYRQPAYGDWASVIHQVVADLTAGD